MSSFFRQILLITVLIMGVCALAATEFNQLLVLAKAKYGEKGSFQVSQWLQMLENQEPLEEINKLLLVNDFFNQRIRFSTDQLIWGRKDYWATPVETLGLQQGDCEDFSIAKYVTLLKMGVPMEKLRLTYVKAKLDGLARAHMVLAYYESPTAEPLILDNLSLDILPASRRTDLFPVFSFNSAGLWVGNGRQSKVKKPETRLSRWRDVLTRMQAEGL